MSAVMPKIHVDEDACELWIDGRRIHLSPAQWDIFYLLWQNGRRWTSEGEARVILYGNNISANTRPVSWHVFMMRPKIAPLEIESRWGYGFRIKQEDKLVM